MIHQIDFNEKLEYGFLGRNGCFCAKGLKAYGSGLQVYLNPITGKGQDARGWISIPKENIQDLIDTLEKLK